MLKVTVTGPQNTGKGELIYKIIKMLNSEGVSCRYWDEEFKVRAPYALQSSPVAVEFFAEDTIPE